MGSVSSSSLSGSTMQKPVSSSRSSRQTCRSTGQQESAWEHHQKRLSTGPMPEGRLGDRVFSRRLSAICDLVPIHPRAGWATQREQPLPTRTVPVGSCTPSAVTVWCSHCTSTPGNGSSVLSVKQVRSARRGGAAMLPVDLQPKRLGGYELQAGWRAALGLFRENKTNIYAAGWVGDGLVERPRLPDCNGDVCDWHHFGKHLTASHGLKAAGPKITGPESPNTLATLSCESTYDARRPINWGWSNCHPGEE